jgi:acyl carrier protein
VLNEEKIIELMNTCLRMNLDPKSTPVDVNFKSLGIDSLDFYNVLVELETMTGRKVPDGDIEKISTIKDLVKYFA